MSWNHQFHARVKGRGQWRGTSLCLRPLFQFSVRVALAKNWNSGIRHREVPHWLWSRVALHVTRIRKAPDSYLGQKNPLSWLHSAVFLSQFRNIMWEHLKNSSSSLPTSSLQLHYSPTNLPLDTTNLRYFSVVKQGANKEIISCSGNQGTTGEGSHAFVLIEVFFSCSRTCPSDKNRRTNREVGKDKRAVRTETRPVRKLRGSCILRTLGPLADMPSVPLDRNQYTQYL